MQQNPDSSFARPTYLSPEAVEKEQAAFMTQVYGWMTIALLITASVAIWTASSEAMLRIILSSRLTFFGLIGVQLLLVMALSSMINRVSATTATAMFIG
jgi:uncharacterized protein